MLTDSHFVNFVKEGDIMEQWLNSLDLVDWLSVILVMLVCIWMLRIAYK